MLSHQSQQCHTAGKHRRRLTESQVQSIYLAGNRATKIAGSFGVNEKTVRDAPPRPVPAPTCLASSPRPACPASSASDPAPPRLPRLPRPAPCRPTRHLPSAQPAPGTRRATPATLPPRPGHASLPFRSGSPYGSDCHRKSLSNSPCTGNLTCVEA